MSTASEKSSSSSSLYFPDYDQSFHHHGQPTIYVRLASSSNSSSSLWSTMVNSERRVRFVRSICFESVEWSLFQAHKGVHGVINFIDKEKETEGKDDDLHDEELSHLKERLARTLIASLTIVVPHVDLDEHQGESEAEVQSDQTSFPSLSESHSTEVLPERHWSKYLTSLIQLFTTKIVEALKLVHVETLNRVNTHLYVAPFELKGFVGIDLESRSNRKRMAARYKKHVADLALLTGNTQEALQLYETAVEQTRSTSDWLWLANSLEGLVSTRVIMDPEVNLDSIITTMREAMIHYSKYRQAGLIETEASLKCVRLILSSQDTSSNGEESVLSSQLKLAAAEFLQNVVFIQVSMNDEEKINRFVALASLYSALDFQRKAAFFYRVAALRCVAPQNPKPDWQWCYTLLREAAHPGFAISVSNECRDSWRMRSTWPSIQLQFLQELVKTALRVKSDDTQSFMQQDDAQAFLALIVEGLSSQLTSTEQKDIWRQLQLLHSQKSELIGHEARLKVNLSVAPKLLRVEPMPLWFDHGSLRSQTTTPFLFTPIVFLGEREKKKSKVVWCVDEECECVVWLENELLVPLTIDVITLIVIADDSEGGSVFESFESSLSMQASSGPVSMKLGGVPRRSGQLKIVGCKLVVNGLESHVGLSSEHHVNVSNRVAKIILDYENNDEEDINLYVGEERIVQAKLSNDGKTNVNVTKISLNSEPSRFASQTCKILKPLSSTFELASGELCQLDIGIVGCEQGSFDLQCSVNFTFESNLGSELQRRVVKSPKKLKVRVQPSMMLKAIDVLPGEECSTCYVILDLLNATQHEIELEYDNKLLVVDPKAVCRLPLLVSRANKDTMESQCLTTSLPNASSRRRRKGGRREERLVAHLQRQVSLQWRHAEAKGSVMAMADVELTNLMMDHLEQDPLKWELRLNGSKWTGTDIEVRSGHPVTFSVSVKSEVSDLQHCFFDASAYYAITGEALKLSTSHADVVLSKNEDFSRFEGVFVPCFPGRACWKCDIELTQDNNNEVVKVTLPVVNLAVSL